MEPKIKYINFLTKECTNLYEGRTCSPYKHNTKRSKLAVSVRKVNCHYKKIITKNCRINDILTFMDTDFLFPMNTVDYANLLIEVAENSTTFFNSLSMMSGNNIGSKILRLAHYPIQENYIVVQSLLYDELEGSFPTEIKQMAKTLRFNLMTCIKIVNDKNTVPEDWIATQVVEDLDNYISNLRTICNFIYLIILKKKSTVVHRILPTIPYSSSKIHICSFCGQVEVVCLCLEDLEMNQNLGDTENMPHCSKSTVHAEIEHADIMNQYLETYGYHEKKSKCNSLESSTDTD